MNILLIIPYNTGTLGRVSYNLYCALKKVPQNNVICVCVGDYLINGFIFSDCLRFKTCGLHLNLFQKICLLKRIKKQYRIKVSISTLMVVNYLNVLSQVDDYTIGVFHTRFNQLKSKGRLYYFIHLLCNKVISSKLNKKIAVNKSAYIDSLKVLGGNVELVYNIHNLQDIVSKSNVKLCQSHEMIFSKPVILYVGSGEYTIKAPDRLLRAFANLPDNIRTSYNLVYLGRNEKFTTDRLETLAKSYNISSHVYFIGYTNNPYVYMKRSSLLVSPSRDEGLPGVLIEALSLGLPCIATNSSRGIWEIMECDESYNPRLDDLFRTKYGYIVTNNLVDDNKTIAALTKAIANCLRGEIFDLREFNTKRFSSKSILPHYLITK